MRAVGILGAIVVFAALSCLVVGAQQEAGFKIVVNTANVTQSLNAEKLSRLFLKKDQQWPDGVEVKPVDLTSSSEVRESFSKAIHGRSVAAIKSYWQKMIFSGREVPPPEKSDEKMVLEYVRSTSGAIGYVSLSTPLVDGVKVLQVAR